jgi:methionyl-tRNA formyltransferase
MKEILPHIQDRSFPRIPQADCGPSSYFGGRRPRDGIISWQKDAISIYNLTRATTHPYPGAFTYLDGRKFFVWKTYPEEGQAHHLPGSVISTKPLVVMSGSGSLKLLRVQLEGEREMDGEAFAATHDIDNKTLGGNT